MSKPKTKPNIRRYTVSLPDKIDGLLQKAAIADKRRPAAFIAILIEKILSENING